MEIGKEIAKCGRYVVHDREDSHLHLPAEMVRIVLERNYLGLRGVKEGDVVVRHLVGALPKRHPCYLIHTGPDWGSKYKIYYKKRGDRPYFSRMVKGATPRDTWSLTIVLKRIGDVFVILTAYAGDPSPKEPGDNSIQTPEEYKKSIHFWRTHALIEH